MAWIWRFSLLFPWLSALAAGPEVISLNDLTDLRVCAPNILRLTRWPSKEAREKGRISLVAKSDWPHADYHVQESPEEIKVTTSKVSFLFSKDKENAIFGEMLSPHEFLLEDVEHSFKVTEDIGRNSHEIRQSWRSRSPSEALYGGGSYQNGLLNYKNAPLSMIQFNLEAVVPFFVSSDGYGLLWDNYAWTYLNPPAAENALVKPIAGKGQSGEVQFQAATSGDYFFHVGRLMNDAKVPSFGGGHEAIVTAHQEGINTTIIRWTRDQQNHPSSITGRLSNVEAGVKYTIRFSFDIPGAGLYVQGPDYNGGLTTLQSEYAEAIDYYYVYGPAVDDIIAGYREITGVAPLYGKFAYGFWQSREHYGSQAELLEAAKEFRSRAIPIDAIVQDWLYWGKLGWGPEWDPDTYPDPANMVKQLKEMNLKLMVSVWGKMDNQTALFKALKPAGMILGDTNQSHDNWYDAWSTEAQKIYYSICNHSHFSIGVESLWLDATEPEGLVNINKETHLGSGNLLMNSYSLETTSGIAQGLRQDYPESQGARVFSLTRSSFAGQQRTGAALWTGDTAGTWDMLRRQVASSINYPLSGIPYWSQDIGGFFRPKDQYVSEQYHQLLVRWFQFGVFTPIFRVHGAGTHTEIWNFGNETMKAINTSAITLRYRLLPYIYSGFWQVETQDYTMQRGLIFDFPGDSAVQNVADEYMFGSALLVTPIVSNASTTSREVYFPRDQFFPMCSWVHFHTGKSYQGGSSSQVNFEINQAPFFVRAGSILVLGPEQQFATEKSKDLEVRIYRGRDASWVLFEDDGHSSKYQRGSFSKIQFSWQEDEAVLSIAERIGSFPEMEQDKHLCIIFVSEGRGLGVHQSSCDKEVVYSGQAIKITDRSTALFA